MATAADDGVIAAIAHNGVVTRTRIQDIVCCRANNVIATITGLHVLNRNQCIHDSTACIGIAGLPLLIEFYKTLHQINRGVLIGLAVIDPIAAITTIQNISLSTQYISTATDQCVVACARVNRVRTRSRIY